VIPPKLGVLAYREKATTLKNPSTELMENVQAIDRYWHYAQTLCPTLEEAARSRIISILERTNLDEPDCALDWNNCGVMALIESEQTKDLTLRAAYFQLASEAFANAKDVHPLCDAHLALMDGMIGERVRVIKAAYNTLANILYPIYEMDRVGVVGLVYLPTSYYGQQDCSDLLEQLFKAEDLYLQSQLLLVEALCRSRIFYRSTGLGLLHLATQLRPNSAEIVHQLGVGSLLSDRVEGLMYLHQASHLAPNWDRALQSLYLGYRGVGKSRTAHFWLKIAQELHQAEPNALGWKWTALEFASPFTYVPFDDQFLLAVEGTFHSIVTSTLIAFGDWFEKEIELWRQWVQPGMTIIDVGANAGIYAFSAAQRVGTAGKVIAIEPNPICVECLQETCRVNQFTQVKVYQAAASDREGTVNLLLSNASELTQVVSDETTTTLASRNCSVVNCLSLDSLIERDSLQRVDFVKIDVESHELTVLMGGERLLSEFSPIVLCEVTEGNPPGNSMAVGQFFQSRGYSLYYYQAFIQEFVPLKPEEIVSVMTDTLSLLIAVPKSKKHWLRFPPVELL